MVLATVRLCCQQAYTASPTIKVHAPNRFASFIDSLRIYARGGTGGTGLPRFGGVGGKGGDVYLEGKSFVESLKAVKLRFPEKRFIAGDGENSARYRLIGKPGRDVNVFCPLGIEVRTESGRVLGELNKDGDKVLVAIGGRGGDLRNQYNGNQGQRQVLILDLKLIADVGFVGYPNAGKSTLLKAISRASPKIANYPFTTISPNIGIVEYVDYRRIQCADLPGLIEGAHENYGLGHKFLKHVERTKLLLFVVDINGFQLSPNSPRRSAIETLLYLSKELELYDERLMDKPTVLGVSKIDTPAQQEAFEQFKEEFEKIKAGHHTGIVEDIKPKLFKQFDEVIPFSSKTSFNIPYLRERLRDWIDFHYEQAPAIKDQPKTYREVVARDKRRLEIPDVKLI